MSLPPSTSADSGSILQHTLLHPGLRGEFIEREAVHLKSMRMEIPDRIVGANDIRIERGVG